MESRLAQVFRNLIANAVSFSPAGGTIDISTQIADGSALIHVDDHGPGIPAGAEESIFERFYSRRRGAPEEQGSSPERGPLALPRVIVPPPRARTRRGARELPRGRLAQREGRCDPLPGPPVPQRGPRRTLRLARRI